MTRTEDEVVVVGGGVGTFKDDADCGGESTAWECADEDDGRGADRYAPGFTELDAG